VTTTYRDQVFISTDAHVTEPIELFAERLPAVLRERAPTILNSDGWRLLRAEGLDDRKLMTASELDIAVVGGADREKRRREQDQDGVAAEVVFPTWALQCAFAPDDPALQLGLCRAYNDWAAEALLGDHRILPVGLVPVLDLGGAVAEAQRLAAAGFRALLLPARVPARPYNDPGYDALWAVVQDLGLPLTFHSGTGYEPRIVRGRGGAVINYLLGAQLDGPSVLLHLAAGGALDRFPGLRVVTVETGAAWLAWVLDQADRIYEDHAMFDRHRLTMKPGELIRRQCHATFMHDPVAVHNIPITGADCLMWGNDYPHPEGTWPQSMAAAAQQFGPLDDQTLHAVVAGNAARVFGFDLDALGAGNGR
jgi:predicted TIM-barrel fold metal-dependent hydrolase